MMVAQELQWTYTRQQRHKRTHVQQAEQLPRGRGAGEGGGRDRFTDKTGRVSSEGLGRKTKSRSECGLQSRSWEAEMMHVADIRNCRL